MKIPEHYRNILLASALACSGAFGVYFCNDLERGLPQEASLLRAGGAATWYQAYKGGVRFRLDGYSDGFNYLSKGNAADKVANAISSSSGQIVSVLYDQDSLFSPFYSKDYYFTAFSVSVGDQSIRSYQQVASAWRSDNRIGYWGGWVMVVIGVSFALHAWRTRSAAQLFVQADR